MLEKRHDVWVWAQRLGLPLAEFSDVARWILQKDCPYCQLASQVLKAIEQLAMLALRLEGCVGKGMNFIFYDSLSL